MEEKEKIQEMVVQPKPIKHVASFQVGGQTRVNPWNNYVDVMGGYDYKNEREYREVIKSSRFFYRRDAMASAVINKLVELSINGLNISKGKINPNHYKIFEHIKFDIEEFIEQCALEYLISGLLIPEIEYGPIDKEELKSIGIKKYQRLVVPVSMWTRDPSSIIIKSPMFGSEESYYVEVDSKIANFIMTDGVTPDGKKDTELMTQLRALYPEFVSAVKRGEKYIKLDDPYVVKRRVLSDSPYPTPFLAPALESLEHKRNIRKMDYSLAARATGAIMQVKIGSDNFPLTADNDEQVAALQEQMYWRDSSKDLERIYQLFTNHVTDIEWIYPPMDALTTNEKYNEINQDILYALGFPRILITGEAQRTGTTDADIAVLSPLKTMEHLRRKLIRIVENIFSEIANRNGFSSIPRVEFMPLNFVGFKDFVESLNKFYESGNLSRTDYANAFGVSFEDTAQQLSVDNELMEELGLTEFAPTPNSRAPENDKNITQKDKNKEQNDQKED